MQQHLICICHLSFSLSISISISDEAKAVPSRSDLVIQLIVRLGRRTAHHLAHLLNGLHDLRQLLIRHVRGRPCRCVDRAHQRVRTHEDRERLRATESLRELAFTLEAAELGEGDLVRKLGEQQPTLAQLVGVGLQRLRHAKSLHLGHRALEAT